MTLQFLTKLSRWTFKVPVRLIIPDKSNSYVNGKQKQGKLSLNLHDFGCRLFKTVRKFVGFHGSFLEHSSLENQFPCNEHSRVASRRRKYAGIKMQNRRVFLLPASVIVDKSPIYLRNTRRIESRLYNPTATATQNRNSSRKTQRMVLPSKSSIPPWILQPWPLFAQLR